MDQGFICGHKLPEDTKLLFSPEKLCWIHFWSDPRSFGTQWADTSRQCKALYSPFYNGAARSLAMVSWVVMMTDLPRQIPEFPIHISSQQPTFSPCFIWRGILPCCEHHVLLDLLECMAFVVVVENDCTMAEVVHFIRNHLWSMLDYNMYKR